MKQFILCLLSIFLTSLAVAQSDIKVKGKVLSAKNGTALPFAYVQLKGFAIGTVTDANGDYAIEIPQKYADGALEFSYLGYEKLTASIADITNKLNFVAKLQESATMLNEVVIEPRKQIGARQLYKKVVKAIEDNYPTEAFNMEAYYRESIRESGAYIKYADAVCQFHLEGYNSKIMSIKQMRRAKWKARKGKVPNIASMQFSLYWGDRLHRGHFDGTTMPDDQLQVIETRISESLTKHRMEANIEGGPIGMIGKDRMKYLRHFMDSKNFSKYEFKVGETQNEAGEWQYVLSFAPIATFDEVQATLKKYTNIFKSRRAVQKMFDKPIAGKLYINQDSYAVTKIEYSVPNEFKEHICGFKTMAIKHFDYKIQIDYQQIGEKWYLQHIQQDDEFIFADTVKQTTTPYLSRKELFVNQIQLQEVKMLDPDSLFENSDLNTIYEYALEYNPDFWETYTKKIPEAIVPEIIRKDMDAEKPLAQQFKDVYIRDENMVAPVAVKKPVITEIHGVTLTDDYAWLKDPKTARSNDEIMDYVVAENKYAANYAKPLRKQERGIYNEMMIVEKREKSGLPSLNRGYWYWSKYRDGDDYPIYLRKADSVGAKEEVMFNVNEMAEKHDGYFSLTGFSIAHDNQLIAYGENTDGSDNSIVRFKNLHTGEQLADSMQYMSGLAWFADGTGFYYARQEKNTNRTSKVFQHILGTPQSEDKLIFEDTDVMFSVSVSTTIDFKYVILSSGSNRTSEYQIKPNKQEADFVMISPRRKEHQYSVSYQEGKLYIQTNRKHINMELMEATIEKPQEEFWKSVLPANPDALLSGVRVFKNYIAVQELGNAQTTVKIINRETKESHEVKLGKKDFGNVSISSNPNANTDTIRLSYNSFKSLSTIYDYDMVSEKSKKVWTDSLRVKFRTNWTVERIWATAPDGKKVPITLLYSKGLRKMYSHNMLWLTSYGAYGSPSLATFQKSFLPLLRRGFVVAIAHVRGGTDMGMNWYEDGRMKNKMNTFTDFIACAEALIAEGLTEKGKIIAQGGSAGGLLMGAIANMRPDLWHTVVLDVPFVDVINTMLDDKLPLTTGEYSEWGNPNIKKEFKNMIKYSPYENVKEQAYPNMLFFTGLNDQRVGYWEPAKMVAKLRESNTSDNLVLLKTDLSSGHGGGSGRFAYYKALAYKYAIIFDLVGKEVEEAAVEN